MILEEKVEIKKEVSVIIARNTKNEIKSFPMVEMEFNPEANLDTLKGLIQAYSLEAILGK